METLEIIKAMKRLPVSHRILIIERTLKTIREGDANKKMTNAAESVFDDYKNDKKLTAFTQLDYGF
ncbi:MAG: hypothetical protein EOM83_11590 [Clostridia bacterium]|nr:hypothetical protein [Clostridia bacterium]